MKTKIHYQTSETLFLFFNCNRFEKDANHIFVPETWKRHYVKMPIEFDDTLTNENIFHKLNIEENPLSTPKMQDWIKKSKVSHTSMSVGDMIQWGEQFFVVLPIGFKKISFIKQTLEKFKVGDIVESKNPFCKYKVLEVLPIKLKVCPENKDFDDLVHTCNKKLFKKVKREVEKNGK